MSVVTFTTDFGTVDGYVGAMKGVVLSLARDADHRRHHPRHSPPRHRRRRVCSGAGGAAVSRRHRAPGGGGPRGGRQPGGHRRRGGRRRLSWVPTTACWPWRRAVPGWPTGSSRRSSAGSRSAPPSTAAMCSPRPRGCWRAGRIPARCGPLLPAIEELVASVPDRNGRPEDGTPAVIVHVDAFGNLITSLPGDFLAPGSWQVRGSGATPLASPCGRGRPTRDVPPGPAGGLRRQRRPGGNRGARGLGRQDRRSGPRAIICVWKGDSREEQPLESP